MADSVPFRRIAVIGTGLIGGSFGLAVSKKFPSIEIVGWDRDAGSLNGALAHGAIQEKAADLTDALRGADLVYIALPVSAIVKSLSPVAAAAEPDALVTDTGSTKALIEQAGRECFRGKSSHFVGGHPMAGKENSGIDSADADLFQGAPYALIANESGADQRIRNFAELIVAVGGRVVWCDAETHDWSVGIVSHLPQLLSVALAQVIQDESDETGFPLALAGPGLHDTLRLAGSPYSVWRDILVANSDNVAHALNRLGQAIEHLQQNLKSNELEGEFRSANDLYKLLHK
ncbi:MAG TPA: prephenate dehydrogenase/arogenate dehydrogenase family protein [Candidatus Acidoferrales bacterium]|nr:prephenate dehydrogenase/arogenate dehydrogenase family protein [Candidatus Acidoferrales bacterium]